MAEPSEATFAGCAFLSNAILDSKSNIDNIEELFSEVYSQFMSNKVQGSKTGYISSGTLSDLSSTKREALLTDLMVGISAVKGVRSWLKNKSGLNISETTIPSAAYMTGGTWPSAVAKFKINAFGMKDFNSSDIILEYDNTFVGVSLKKRPTAASPSPTLINKAFDTVLNGTQFTEVKKKLSKARQDFFCEVIREAFNPGNPLSNLSAVLPPGKTLQNISDEDLWKVKVPVKHPSRGAELVPLINLKDTTTIEDPTLLSPEFINSGNENEMRDFVNKRLGKVNNQPNTLYKQFLEIIQDNQDLIIDTLINIILKKDIADILSETGSNFEFLLVEGVGEVKTVGRKDNKTLSISHGDADVYSIHSTLCAMAYMRNAKKTIEIDQAKTSSSSAAKLYLKIKATENNRSLTLLDLELRYKGSFTVQPQFQAFLNKEMKDLIKGDWQ